MRPSLMDDPDLSLEISSTQMHQMMALAMRKISVRMDTLNELPSHDLDGGLELARTLREPLPQKGETFEEILETLFTKCLSKGINFQSPGFMGYIPVGGLQQSAVAEFITFALNQWPSIFDMSPGFVQLEQNVLKWLCQIVGMPESAGGVLTSGGSMANFTAIFTARTQILPENFLNGTLYCSDQAHHSIMKSAVIAGFPAKNVRQIETDEKYCIKIPELEKQIAADRAAGMSPFMIVGNAGTTSMGSVDDLSAIARIANKQKIWFHADAAWAGAFRLTERGKKLMVGIEEADSVTIDPHKAFYTPYGCGALLVRDPQHLIRAHSVDSNFLPLENSDSEKINFGNMSMELSRQLRGLQLWLPLKLHGIKAFTNNCQEKLELTHFAYSELKKIPEIEITMEPQLPVLAFRVKNPKIHDKGLCAFNEKILDDINAYKKVYLSGAKLKGKFLIRISPAAYATHKSHVLSLLEIIKKVVSTNLGSHS
jgi:aromatic-L-amino-acid decarboxylase